MTDEKRLLDDFPVPALEEWRALAEEQLGGAPFEKKLITRTPEGIAVQPLYTRAGTKDLPHLGEMPGFGRYVRGIESLGYETTPWAISQELPYGTPSEFNAALLEDLMRGQTGVNLLLDVATVCGKDPDSASAGEVGACGVSISTLGDLDTALDRVLLEYVPLHVQAGASGTAFMALLKALLDAREVPGDRLTGALNHDPLSALIRSGRLSRPWADAAAESARLAAWTHAHLPQFRSIGVSSLPYNEGGGSAVEELAYTLAAGAEYLRAMGEQGMDADAAASQLQVTLSIGPRFFFEIAKIRAFRMLWSQMLGAFGCSPQAARACIHLRTTHTNKTHTDPYVNMLRATTEAMAGAIGGCQSMHAAPFDETLRVPDTFSRRIARNLQVILQEECEITHVVDPAGGAYAIEQFTHEIAQAAWKLFQETEASGGLIQALADGRPQARIGEVLAERLKKIDQRRDVLVGTNQYANTGEEPLPPRLPDYAALRETRARAVAQYRNSAETEDDAQILAWLEGILHTSEDKRIDAAVSAAAAGATLGEISRTLDAAIGAQAEGLKISPIALVRWAEKYERLRLAARLYRDANGHRPRIYLANLGKLRQHKLRADFSQSFLTPGGFEVVYPEGASSDDAARAFIDSGAPVAVICSTDETYPVDVPTFCRKVKGEDPARHIILAGHPGEHEQTYRDAGLDDYIFIKTDNYACLEGLMRKIGAM